MPVDDPTVLDAVGLDKETGEVDLQAEGRSIRIDVVCRYPAPEEGQKFFGKARDIVSRNGWSFAWAFHAA